MLFVIDPRPYQAEMDRTDAELRQAQTRFELASNDFVRGERLLKARAISDEEADARHNAERTSAAAIESAQAAVEIAKLNMEYTRVTAPISGRIGRRMITEGNLGQWQSGTIHFACHHRLARPDLLLFRRRRTVDHALPATGPRRKGRLLAGRQNAL